MRWPVGDQRGAGGNVRGSRYRVRRRKGSLPREVGPCRGQRPAPFWGEGGVLTAAPGMGPAPAHPFLRQDAAHLAAGDGDAPPPDGHSQRIQAPLGLRVGMPKVHLPALQRPICPGGSLRVNAITTPRSRSVRRRVRPVPRVITEASESLGVKTDEAFAHGLGGGSPGWRRWPWYAAPATSR